MTCCFSWFWPSKRPENLNALRPPEALQNAARELKPEDRHFDWDSLVEDVQCRKDFCNVMAAQGFAVLAIQSSLQENISQMNGLAEQFFSRPREERCAVGRLRLYRNKVIGYRELGGGSARFLEVHALAGGGAIPNPKVPGLVKLACALHRSFQGMARQILSWLAEHRNLPPEALLQCIDTEALNNLEDGDCSASVLRLCSYGFESEAEPETTAEESVVFDEHTDSSFLTLAAIGSSPGLQFRDPTDPEKWLEVESGLPQSKFVVVFVGDFLEVLTKGAYAAAPHRVCCNEDGSGRKRRFSMPYLVRGQPSSVIDTSSFIDKEEQLPLLRLEGVKYSDLRQFLDLKGRQRFCGQRLLESEECFVEEVSGGPGVEEILSSLSAIQRRLDKEIEKQQNFEAAADYFAAVVARLRADVDLLIITGAAGCGPPPGL